MSCSKLLAWSESESFKYGHLPIEGERLGIILYVVLYSWETNNPKYMQKHFLIFKTFYLNYKNKVPVTTNNPSEETLVKFTIKNLTALITVIDSWLFYALHCVIVCKLTCESEIRTACSHSAQAKYMLTPQVQILHRFVNFQLPLSYEILFIHSFWQLSFHSVSRNDFAAPTAVKHV